MGRHLHIDPFAGIAGDMFLGACIDLGADLQAIDQALAPLPLTRPYRLTVQETQRHAIRGIDVKVIVGEDRSPGPADTRAGEASHSHDHHHAHGHHHDHDHSHEHDHGRDAIGQAHLHPEHCGYRQIMALIDSLATSERGRARARAIFTRIGEAEAHVHGVGLDVVHFHEVGAVDSIVDILGSAVALELLDVETVTSAPLPIGQGFVQCAHGNMPLPAPATAQILRHVPHHGVEREGETVTPTGAAIIAALATGFGPMPAMRVDQIGYGAGDRDTPDVPNLLRLFLGQRLEPEAAPA